MLPVTHLLLQQTTEYIPGDIAHLCFEDFLTLDRSLSKTPCGNEYALDGAVYANFRSSSGKCLSVLSYRNGCSRPQCRMCDLPRGEIVGFGGSFCTSAAKKGNCTAD